jgi:putative acetyltransferase
MIDSNLLRSRQMPPLVIREEIPADHDAIREVNRQAFNGDAEATLVDRLRASGAVIVSLVAVQNGEVVGHILFSDLPIDYGATATIHAVSLAPMAVAPKFQRRGIGSALVQRGLELCRERGKSIVVVLGHPEYYPRFGFSAELAKPLESPYSGLAAAWMALELVPGALDGIKGTVRYPEAFEVVS